MEDAHRKTALRMIPYGLYVLTTRRATDGAIAAATVNWVTQTSFTPPLVAVGVKANSFAHELVSESGAFVLNVLGKDQNAAAFEFFKSVDHDDERIGEHPYRLGATGSPVLDDMPAFVECSVTDIVSRGDHTLFVAEVVEAAVRREPEGRADDATLWMRDLGERIYYGG